MNFKSYLYCAGVGGKSNKTGTTVKRVTDAVSTKPIRADRP